MLFPQLEQFEIPSVPDGILYCTTPGCFADYWIDSQPYNHLQHIVNGSSHIGHPAIEDQTIIVRHHLTRLTMSTTTTNNTEQDLEEQEQPIKKKRRQQALWQEIPTSSQYHVSLMHRDVVTHVVSSQKHGYVVTASQDGVVKFWKRVSVDQQKEEKDATKDANAAAAPAVVSQQCLEFVKSFTAHVGAVLNLVVSHEGDTVVSVGIDRVIKVYDVSTFDVTGMIKIENDTAAANQKIGPAVLLAQDCLALALDESIRIYELDTLSLAKTIQLHAAPITAMVYNYRHNCVLSTDRKGIIELWQAAQNNVGSAPVHGISYTSKSETDLYCMCLKKTCCLAAIATNGSHYALYGKNGIIYLLDHASGKVVVKFDERLKVYDESYSTVHELDALEYGKRAATEREMAQESPIFGEITTTTGVEQQQQQDSSSLHQSISITFDASGNYLLVPTLVGIKVLDWARRKVVKIIGKDDASGLRFLSATLCHGDAKVNQQMQLARTGGSKTAMNFDALEKLSDALLISLAYQKRRFFVFSHASNMSDGEDDGAVVERDILNEPPTAEDRLLADSAAASHTSDSKLGSTAILRTSMGDIHMKLFLRDVPKTIENFCTHARGGYYDNVIFHRIISNFMLQTGDPLGDGTGGESIWGGEFEDEFVRNLKHDRPFTVSMANAGPSELLFCIVLYCIVS